MCSRLSELVIEISTNYEKKKKRLLFIVSATDDGDMTEYLLPALVDDYDDMNLVLRSWSCRCAGRVDHRLRMRA